MNHPDPSDNLDFYNDPTLGDIEDAEEDELTFETEDVSIGGTHLVGHLEIPYSKIVQTFGEPTLVHGDESVCEWAIRFSDGTVATIYDWKWGMSPGALRDTDHSHWNIGGRGYRAVSHVREFIARAEQS